MRMTKELAQRILDRQQRKRATKLTDAQRTEMLMDWLDGATLKNLVGKYQVSKSTATKLIRAARDEAAKVLGVNNG